MFVWWCGIQNSNFKTSADLLRSAETWIDFRLLLLLCAKCYHFKMSVLILDVMEIRSKHRCNCASHVTFKIYVTMTKYLLNYIKAVTKNKAHYRCTIHNTIQKLGKNVIHHYSLPRAISKPAFYLPPKSLFGH